MSTSSTHGLRGRILVADTPAGAKMIQNVLGADFELIHARSIEQALPALRTRLSAIVCGLHFDGSRMFDLLRAAKGGFSRDVPFICYRDLESDLGPPVIEGMEIATAVMGATVFIDTYTLKRRYGIPRADDVLRSYVLEGGWTPPAEPANRGSDPP